MVVRLPDEYRDPMVVRLPDEYADPELTLPRELPNERVDTRALPGVRLGLLGLVYSRSP